MTPTKIENFGPNGTHWPSGLDTPFFYDPGISNIVTVACSLSAIRTALTSVTDEEANAGTLILVEPGELIGTGVSGGTPFFLDIGSTSRTKRITIGPRDGYGTVTLSGGLWCRRVYGVCFAGLIFDQAKFEGCTNGAIAWSSYDQWLAVYGNSIVTTTSNFEVVEVVRLNSSVNDGDVINIASNGAGLQDVSIEGCWFAPNFFELPDVNDAHTDTLQYAGSGGGSYGSMTIQDTVVWSSNNAAVQVGSVQGLDFIHSYIISGSASLSVYPHLDGGSDEATVSALNGGGDNFTALDCYFIGGLALSGDPVWDSVINSVWNRSSSSGVNVPISGDWTYDPASDENDSEFPALIKQSDLDDFWADPKIMTNPPDTQATQAALDSIKSDCDTLNALGIGTSTITASDLSSQDYEAAISTQKTNQDNLNTDNSLGLTLTALPGTFEGNITALYNNLVAIEAALS